MSATKVKAAACWLLVAGAAFSSSLAAEKKPSAAKPAIADADLTDLVAKRIDGWKPTAMEKRFDEIAWVKDIREALRLGKEHNRPVFLFTHKGRMNIGRC
jgi:hypothetical protein